MGAFAGLSNYLDRPLSQYAKEYGYDVDNIAILEGDEQRLRREFPETYNNLLSCRHHKDNRTLMEYGQDLVASWIFEDYFLDEMQNASFSIGLSGADRNRKILSNTRTSSASDYIVSAPNGFCIKIELVNDYTGFWYKNQKLHLRDNKYNQLARQKSLLLAIALSTDIRQFALFDFRYDIPAKYIESHYPYGGKPAYELSISRDMLNSFSIDNVKAAINASLRKAL
jgi:hypothetical protein